MFQRKGRLFAAALCAVMAAMLIVPAAAHGHYGGHHSGYCQSVYSQPAYAQSEETQPAYTPNAVAVCPYEDCTVVGQHDHDGTLYCGYGHRSAYVQSAGTQSADDQTVIAVCPYEDCPATGQHHHNGIAYCGYDHANGCCDGSCDVTPYYYGYSYGGCSHGFGYGHHGCW